MSLTNLEEQADRLRALWKSGRDKYASFFAILEDVRQEIGNDALPNWCFGTLSVSLSIITETRRVLTKTDADIVKRNLAAANASEKAATRKAREASRKLREDEALAHKLAKQDRAKKIAEAEIDAERKKTEAEQAKTETKKAKEQRRGGTKRRKRSAAEFSSEISTASLNDLVECFKNADALCRHGENEWVEGSIAKAIILAAAREKCRSDQDFGAWCSANIDLNKNDRAALVHLGRLGEAQLRELFNDSGSRSYQLIWERHKPGLRVLEAAVS